MKNIVIIGAGGLAREVFWLISDINKVSPQWNVLGYIEASENDVGKVCGTGKIIGTERFIREYNEGELNVVIGIGNPKTIDRVSHSLAGLGHVVFPNLLHPMIAGDFDRIDIGRGNIIGAGSVLTTDIKIGSFNILNISCTYGHDTQIGDCCVVNPGSNISGNVIIGDMCLLGTGCTVLEGRKIGNNVTVGAAALVNKDVAAGQVVVGVPARPIELKTL